MEKSREWNNVGGDGFSNCMEMGYKMKNIDISDMSDMSDMSVSIHVTYVVH